MASLGGALVSGLARAGQTYLGEMQRQGEYQRGIARQDELRSEDEKRRRREEELRSAEAALSQLEAHPETSTPEAEAQIHAVFEKYGMVPPATLGTLAGAGQAARTREQAKGYADVATQEWEAFQKAPEAFAGPGGYEARVTLAGHQMRAQRPTLAQAIEPRAGQAQDQAELDRRYREAQIASLEASAAGRGQGGGISGTSLWSTVTGPTETQAGALGRSIEGGMIPAAEVPRQQARLDSMKTELWQQAQEAQQTGRIPQMPGRLAQPTPQQAQGAGALQGIPADFIAQGRAKGATDEQIAQAWREYLSSQGR